MSSTNNRHFSTKIPAYELCEKFGLIAEAGELTYNLPMQTTSRNAHLALIFGATAIAFSPIFVRLSELGPVTVAFYRVSLAVIPIWLWTLRDSRKRYEPQSTRDYLLLASAGLWFAMDLGAWHWSIRLTSVANATLLGNLAPVFVTLVVWLVFKETPTKRYLLGLCLAIIGLVLLAGDSHQLGGTRLMGDTLGVLTGFFYAGYLLTISRLSKRFSISTLILWSSGIAAIILLPFAIQAEDALLPTTLNGWLILIGLAWFSHAIGQGLIAMGLANLPVAYSSLILLWQPVLAAALGWILLSEKLSILQLCGSCLVLAAIVLAKTATTD